MMFMISLKSEESSPVTVKGFTKYVDERSLTAAAVGVV